MRVPYMHSALDTTFQQDIQHDFGGGVPVNTMVPWQLQQQREPADSSVPQVPHGFLVQDTFAEMQIPLTKIGAGAHYQTSVSSQWLPYQH